MSEILSPPIDLWDHGGLYQVRDWYSRTWVHWPEGHVAECPCPASDPASPTKALAFALRGARATCTCRFDARHYVVGQCPGCGRIYWRQVSPAPAGCCSVGASRPVVVGG